MAFSLSSKPTGAQPTKKGKTHGTWSHNITPPTEEESQDAHPRGRPRRCLKSNQQGHSPPKKEQTHGTWTHNITPLTKQESQDAHPRGLPRRCLDSHCQGHSPTTKEQTHGTWPHNITPLIKQKTWAHNMNKSPRTHTFRHSPRGASRAIVEGTAQPKITKAQHTINCNAERMIQITIKLIQTHGHHAGI